MKILLVGEYSGLHNSLKAGLCDLGHEVKIVSAGDSFKNFPSDISIAPKLTRKNPVFKFLKRVVYKITSINLEETETGLRFWKLLPDLQNYDVVQLINSNALETHPFLSRYLLKKLFRNNKRAFLLVCGDETPVVDYLLKRELSYDILTPYFLHPHLKKNFEYTLKYTQKPYRKLFEFVNKHCQSLIVSDLDYKIPLESMGMKATFIPNPVVLDKINPIIQKPNQKISIFLGINSLSKEKKGIPFFEKALEVINEKYPDNIEITIVENLPYAEYIKHYDRAHILLDQVYAYDQGYNALEAMAKGKVVFTGAEKEFLEHYNLQEDEVCINALPDVDALVEKLSWLIENPAEIERIGKNAHAFIEREHHYVKVAEKYLKTWMKQ